MHVIYLCTLFIAIHTDGRYVKDDLDLAPPDY